MAWRALANLVVLAHLGFIVFAVAGGFLALRWRWLPWLHLPAALWAAANELAGWSCPLTPLENRLREASGAARYGEGFVEHYLLPILYPGELTRGIQIALGLAVTAINLVAYGLLVQRTRRGRKGAA